MLKQNSRQWKYLDLDDPAIAILEDRIAACGKRDGLLTYTDLAKGVCFNLKTCSGYVINTPNWTPMDSEIIGEYLSYISIQSYANYGFMASALVFREDLNQSSPPFFDLARAEGWLVGKTKNKNVQDDFWMNEVRKAHIHYR